MVENASYVLIRKQVYKQWKEEEEKRHDYATIAWNFAGELLYDNGVFSGIFGPAVILTTS